MCRIFPEAEAAKGGILEEEMKGMPGSQMQLHLFACQQPAGQTL